MWKIILLGTGLGASLIVGINLGWIPFLGLIILAGAAGAAFTLSQRATLTLGELETALVVNKQTGNFARFLSPGRHWIDPLTEEVAKKLPLNSQSVKATSEGIQTNGGIPIKVSWQLSYAIRPTKISQNHLTNMARAFKGSLDGMLQKRITAALQHVVGNLTPQDLTAQGSIKRLERQIKQICRIKLEDKGIKVGEVLIHNIQLPRHVRESLEAAHERELLADQEARILERLHKVVSTFSAEEMDRLLELERIQLLGRNGVTMVMPTSSNQLESHPTRPIR